MKRLLFIPVIIIILYGCTYDPRADFSASSTAVEPNEVVYFTNFSDNSDEYRWDFGDLSFSDDVNPEHYYQREGTYTVSLTAYGDEGGKDIASLDIDVYYTQLEVNVVEWNVDMVEMNYIPDAEVSLYLTYNDWLNLRNPVEIRYTNSDGFVVFTQLEPIAYYIYVYHPYYGNFDLGYEDSEYIVTLPLEKTMINTFTAWVDYYPLGSSKKIKDFSTDDKIKSGKRTFKEQTYQNNLGYKMRPL